MLKFGNHTRIAVERAEAQRLEKVSALNIAMPVAELQEWEGLATQFEQIRNPGEVLWAQWHAFVGKEDYGIWLLRPEGGTTYEARISFSLVAAKAIEKLGIMPVPIPASEQHYPEGKRFCEVEEDLARRSGGAIDLSDAVPHGLGVPDRDAVDPCTRAWLEVLRKESPAFNVPGTGTIPIGGKQYETLVGEIRNVARVSAIFCRRLAREAIRERLSQRKPPAVQSVLCDTRQDLDDGIATAPSPPATPEAAQGPTGDANSPIRRFRKEGKVWEIAFAGKCKSVPHSLGMDYIAYLLARPHVVVEALALASPPSDGEMKQVISGGLDVADEKTIREAEEDLEEKRTTLAGLGEKDWIRRGELTEQIRKIEEYLSIAKGHAGAVRKIGGSIERARSAVANAIRRAVDNIRLVHPELADHLEKTIRKGNSLAYTLEEENPGWET